MRKFIVAATLLLIFNATSNAAKHVTENGDIVKTGWNFGPFPVVGFDSDLGFQYGARCDIFNFGDGSSYPSYKFKINVEASAYTKGSSILRCYGDFNNLIPEGKLFFDITYFNAPKFGFYGFNGFASGYDPDRIIGTAADDAKSGLNFMSRKQFRVVTSVKKKIIGNLNWAAGLAFYHTATDYLDTEKYDAYKGQETLYGLYRESGLIRENEAEGGNVLQLRAGLVYDSRDHDSDPTRGINIETAIIGAPDVDRKGYDNLGFTFIGSQYVPIVNSKLTFAYRLGLQRKICGDIPFYFINNLNTMFFHRMYTEALGGNASVRGINRNGVLGDGIVWLNMELRWNVYSFKLIKQNWSIALNPFFDAGQVIQSHRLDEQKAAIAPSHTDYDLYSGKSETLHCTAGLGFKLIMNRNMIVSVEAAKAMSANDGRKLWTNVGFNYMF